MSRESPQSAAAPVAGIAAIRSSFPALERRVGDVPVAYFDGPGGTQVPRPVADAVSDYLLHHNANTHWAYPTSLETDALLAEARRRLASFLNASPSEVAFGANMTTLAFHVARALGREWGSGDEVVVTELDHQANVAPWQALARERGLVLRTARMRPETGEIDRADLERSIGPRTRLVAIGAASNALGTITDVRQAAEIAHAAGALVFVDAVHYAPHVLVDVAALGCDLLACSAYKFYGPHVGVLFVRQALLERLDVPKLAPAPDTAPERLETGTQNHEGIVGAGAAVQFLASLGGGDDRQALATVFAAVHDRGRRLVERLWEGLRGTRGVTVYGPPPSQPRTPTVSFSVEGREPTDVARHLAARGVFVSHGDFYATTVVARLGRAPQGLVRAGCACYTTENEVERLVSGVREIAGR
jgi:cysteine desulfurase family protein (TIGR01976 family)